MGTPGIFRSSFEGFVIDDRYEILAVVTQPDRAVGRKKGSKKLQSSRLQKKQASIYHRKLSEVQMEDIMKLGAMG